MLLHVFICYCIICSYLFRGSVCNLNRVAWYPSESTFVGVTNGYHHILPIICGMMIPNDQQSYHPNCRARKTSSQSLQLGSLAMTIVMTTTMATTTTTTTTTMMMMVLANAIELWCSQHRDFSSTQIAVATHSFSNKCMFKPSPNRFILYTVFIEYWIITFWEMGINSPLILESLSRSLLYVVLWMNYKDLTVCHCQLWKL